VNLSDYNDGEYLKLLFSNLLVLKIMNDRGYKVKEISLDDCIFGYCLEAIFGEIKYEPFVPKYDEDFASQLGEDSDDRYIYDEFHAREHFKALLPIPELKDLAENELSAIAEKLNSAFNWTLDMILDQLPEKFIVYRWEWAKNEAGKITGITLYIADYSQYMERPGESEEIIALLEVLDQIKEFSKGKGEEEHADDAGQGHSLA
jgi:hypothetical protein